MSDNIACPKCGKDLSEPLSQRVRDQFIHYYGKCTCGYEISSDEVLERLKKNFDFEKESEILDKPLEILLDKAQTENLEETRNWIVMWLINRCEQRAKQSNNYEEIEMYIRKIIKFKQLLQEKDLNEEQILVEFGSIYKSKKWFQKAAECLEHALSLKPGKAVHEMLADTYKDMGRFDEALTQLEKANEFTDHQYQITNNDLMSVFYQNYYSYKRGELLFKKRAYSETINVLQRVPYTPEAFKFQGGEVSIEDFMGLWKPWNVSAKRLLLKAFVRLEDYNQALNTYNEILSIDSNYENGEYLLDEFVHKDAEFFLYLIKMLLDQNKAKAFIIAQGMEPGILDYPGEQFIPFFLKGKIYMEYCLHEAKENESKEQFLSEADKCLQEVMNIIERETIGGPSAQAFFDHYWMEIPNFWEPLFGSVEKILPDAHMYRGVILEELGEPEKALVQYKKATEYESYEQDKELIIKMSTVKTKMLENHYQELKDELDAMRKKLALPQLDEADTSVARMILIHLESIQTKIPKIKELKDISMYIGMETPRHIFKECRVLFEPYFNRIYQLEKYKRSDLDRKAFDLAKKRGQDRPSFEDKIKALEIKGVINAYIARLMSLIWSSGGKAGHPADNPWVESLRIEDGEVIVASTVRFLSWYLETYP